jgi:pimeloyl-ACP methyl ester carboxylesterase
MNSQVKRSESKLKTTLGRVLQMIGAIIIVLILLGGIGRVYQSASEAKFEQKYHANGQMVDIGGYRLHLSCTGQGSPTVVLESGLAEPALEWASVQQSLEKTTRVCSYDRAGLGWSEVGPARRTSQQMVNELHTLLLYAGVQGPYVLVGHSLGGFNVRLFAHEYPTETAGIVLVASGNENDNARMPPEYRKIEESNLQSDRLLITLTPFGVTRMAGDMGLLSAYTSVLSKFPAGLRTEFIGLTFYRSQYWSTAYAELSALNESRAQVAATGSLGDLPLVVLSGSPDISRLPASFPVEQIKRTYQDLQVELADLSTHSTLIVCEPCDQNIPMTNPEKVVEAINQELANVPH